MSLRISPVPSRSRRRSPVEQPVARIPPHLTGATALLLLLGLSLPAPSGGQPAASPDDPAPSPAKLAVSVSQVPDAVRLRIQVSGAIEPGSLELRLEGRTVVALARSPDGRPIQSQPSRLPAPVAEDGATAEYDGDDVLVMTLRTENASRADAPPDDPGSAAP